MRRHLPAGHQSGWSIKELADNSGISQRTVQRYIEPQAQKGLVEPRPRGRPPARNLTPPTKSCECGLKRTGLDLESANICGCNSV
ncbi:helix-turn-helix domain-containing protein [Phragmitibacter flavus]|uniref:helix-turn-helix domain-containing protein n=1 Tax=Phragmitibacter flavus TaxID=2576071 RepID=UPI001409B429